MTTITNVPLYVELPLIHVGSLFVYWLHMKDYSWISVFRSYRAFAASFQIQGFFLSLYLENEPEKWKLFVALSIYFVLPCFLLVAMFDYHISHHSNSVRKRFVVTEVLLEQEFIRFWSNQRRLRESPQESKELWDDHMNRLVNRLRQAYDAANFH